jgi:hypothetical protein
MGRVAWRITILVLWLTSHHALAGPADVDAAYGRCHERGTVVTASPALKAAITAYDRGQYSAAYQQFYTLANQGDAIAQFFVGCLHDGFHLGMTQWGVRGSSIRIWTHHGSWALLVRPIEEPQRAVGGGSKRLYVREPGRGDH